MKILPTLVVMSSLFFVSTGHAASYDFNMTFDGTSVSVDPGSDDPIGAVFDVGDDFTLMLSAAGADFWRVTEAVTDAFVPLAFFVDPYGERFADISTVWSLDGTETASQTESNVYQAYVHAGANTWTLPVDVEFDKVTINWILLSQTSSTEIMSDGPDLFLGLGGGYLFFTDGPDNGRIDYVTAAVPLPAAGLLYLPVLAAGGAAMMARRRRRG